MQTPEQDRREDHLAMSLGISHQAHIARHGETLGEPAAKERLAEILGRSPTKGEVKTFRHMRNALGRDPTAEELAGYQHRRHDAWAGTDTKGGVTT